MEKEATKSVLSLLCKAILAVSIGSATGHYFPDLNVEMAVFTISGFLAVKYLTSFGWVGTFVAFMVCAGLGQQHSGASTTTFIFSRSLFTIAVFYAMAYMQANHPKGKA